MSDTRPTPETDAAAWTETNWANACVTADFARRMERERDEAASAINTNVRLFDLVRYSRAILHEDELITDEEYAWLCGGAEMANSPKGGSPSPRRLEDYDDLSKQLEAMREVIKEAHDIFYDLAEHIDACDEEKLLACDNDSRPPSMFSVYGKYAKASLAKLQPFLKP